jgi:hypothetical protein
MTFVIEPHFRLQEWVAEEKGLFRAHGLDYEFREKVRASAGAIHRTGDKVGAYQSIEGGRNVSVSCACHWTVNVAASANIRVWPADAYSVAPSGIFVPADSPVRRPEDLAGVPISVGYQSGSHYATIQCLEQFLDPADIELNFADGMLFGRMETFLDGGSPACTLFSGPYYFAEQLGFRKVADNSFMIAATIAPDADADDVRRYYAALRQAQVEIDLRPERYTHYYRNEFPERFHAAMDTRRWGPGERIVFETYTAEMYRDSFDWIAQHRLFEGADMGDGDYDRATVSLNS